VFRKRGRNLAGSRIKSGMTKEKIKAVNPDLSEVQE